MSSKKTPREHLMDAAEHLRQMDFRVFVTTDEKSSFGYYSDEKHVAYIQANDLRAGFNIAIVCQTPGSNGRHLLIEPDLKTVPLRNLTKEYLQKGFANYPDYFDAEAKQMMPHIKHYDLDDFLKTNETSLMEVW